MKEQSLKLQYILVVFIVVTLVTGVLVQRDGYSKSEHKGEETIVFTCESVLDLPALVSLVDAILIGNVSNITNEIDYSYIDISVSEYVKGLVEDTTITIKMFRVVAAPSFAVDERAILFLMMENDHFELASWGQGKYTIEIDPATEKEILRETGENLDEFVSQIREIMATTLEDRGRKI